MVCTWYTTSASDMKTGFMQIVSSLFLHHPVVKNRFEYSGTQEGNCAFCEAIPLYLEGNTIIVF